jgi:hypothetical protein
MGMGFNLADSYAQLQLFGTSGAYIDFQVSANQDYSGRIIYLAASGFNINSATTFGGAISATNFSASASASTVVTRDSNAYIFAAYFNAPANSASPTTTAPTSMIGRASASDKYYYDFSAGAVASFISGQSMNIAGNATYSLNSTRLYASDAPYTYGGAAPYYMYMTYDGTRWLLQVTPATPSAVRVSYADSAGNAATTSQTAFSTLTVNSNTTTGTTAGVVNLGTTGDPSSISNSSIIGLTWGLRGDSQGYYIVRSNNMTYGGYTYNRLDLSWHTGIVIGAATTYGGIRFWNNSTNIGSLIASIGDGDNNMRSTADIIAYASDKRLKENITNIPNALDKIKQINGVYFDWKDETKELGFEPSQKHNVGVIAQEIQAILPEVVTLAPFDYELGKSKSGENYLTVKYDKIVPLLIEAVKELAEKNKKLEQKNEEFEALLHSLINKQK